VLTCTECLRSCSAHVTEEVNPEVVETACIFCFSKVRDIIDFSLSVAPRREQRRRVAAEKPSQGVLTFAVD
jgi:hypothetical protein